MLALIIVLILVSGYIYSTNHLPSRYKMAKTDGWDLYFQVAKRGSELTILSFAICTFIDMANIIGPAIKYCLGWMYDIHFKQLPFTHHQLRIFTWGAFTIIFSRLVAYLRSRKYGENIKEELNLLRHVVRDNPLEFFVIDATLTFVDNDQDSRVVCITLSSKKVYIGFCVGGNNVTHGNLEHIKIIPIRSGYRNKDTLNLVIENNYEEYFIEHPSKISDFVILIPTSEITTYQYFDLPAYDAIQAKTGFSENKYPKISVQLK